MTTTRTAIADLTDDEIATTLELAYADSADFADEDEDEDDDAAFEYTLALLAEQARRA